MKRIVGWMAIKWLLFSGLRGPVMHHSNIIEFELGSLKVYRRAGAQLSGLNGQSPVYWQDKGGIEHGPFASIHAAMENYAWVSSTLKALMASPPKPQLPQDPIIHVDFTTRRRL